MEQVLWPQYPPDPPPDDKDNESVREKVLRIKFGSQEKGVTGGWCKYMSATVCIPYQI